MSTTSKEDKDLGFIQIDDFSNEQSYYSESGDPVNAYRYLKYKRNLVNGLTEDEGESYQPNSWYGRTLKSNLTDVISNKYGNQVRNFLILNIMLILLSVLLTLVFYTMLGYSVSSYLDKEIYPTIVFLILNIFLFFSKTLWTLTNSLFTVSYIRLAITLITAGSIYYSLTLFI